MKIFKFFKKQVVKISDDKQLQKKIDFATAKYYQKEDKGIERFRDFEAARDYISQLRRKTFADFEHFLTEFKTNFEKKGGKVFIAQNSEQANELISSILKKHNVKVLVKSKSMATEEIGLNKFLAKNNITVYETDLGEFIVQIANQRPFHIISPALHMSKQDVINLYVKKFKINKNASIEQITAFTRNYLRTKFFEAQAGITGANFLVADLGAIALTENEGNGLLTFSLPKIHIIVAGYEKLIPSYKDLSLLWQIMAYRGTGQDITVYNSLILPSENKLTYLILLDNGRKRILENEFDREILKCLRCGSCYYYCPVYKVIGGHSYDSVYGGPMGIVLSPLLYGIEKYGHLAYACTLCNKCVEVCPAKIPLTDMILDLRRRYVENGFSPTTEKIAMKSFALLGKKRWLFNISAAIKNFFLIPFISRLWGKKRLFPKFKNSFVKRYGNS